MNININFFNLIIEILTILSIVFALAVITSTNPVIAISFLIALFLTVASYLILMGLYFIGLSYLLIYIGAITVLILFIIMMISVDILQTVEVGTDYSKLLPLAYFIAILFLALFLITIPSFIIDFSTFEIYNIINDFILLLFNKDISKNTINTDFLNHFELFKNIKENDLLIYTNNIPVSLINNNLQIQTIGQALYGKYSLLLIISSFLLLLALIAPIVLNKQNTRLS